MQKSLFLKEKLLLNMVKSVEIEFVPTSKSCPQERLYAIIGLFNSCLNIDWTSPQTAKILP